jgi:hypothetical protein
MIGFNRKVFSNETKTMCLNEEKRETSNCCKDSEQLLDQSLKMDSAEKPLNSIRIEDEGSKSLEPVEQSKTKRKSSVDTPDPKLKRAKVSRTAFVYSNQIISILQVQF